MKNIKNIQKYSKEFQYRKSNTYIYRILHMTLINRSFNKRILKLQIKF